MAGFVAWVALGSLPLGWGCSGTGDDDDDDDSAAGDPCEQGTVDDGGVCVPEACGTGTWGHLEVDDSTVYVDQAAEEGGDGSQQAPLNTIAFGMDTAYRQGGALVAVAAGVYVENLMFTGDHDGVLVAGRCPDLVTLDGSGLEGEQAIMVTENLPMSADGRGVRGLTITGSTYLGLEAGAGDFEVTDCIITGNQRAGIFVSTNLADLTLRDVTVHGNLADAPTWSYGTGILVMGGTLAAERTVVHSNESLGIAIMGGGADATLTDVTVRGNTHEGVVVNDDSTLVMTDSLIEGNGDVGLNLHFNGSAPSGTATVHNTTIRTNLHNEDGLFGYGIQVQAGTLTLTDSLIEDNVNTGIAIFNAAVTAGVVDTPAEVVLENTTVRGTWTPQGQWLGFGVQLMEGPSLTARDSVIEGNETGGLAIIGATVPGAPRSEVSLDGVIVRDTYPDVEGCFGYGVAAIHSGQVDIVNSEFVGNAAASVLASGSYVDITVQGGSIRETRRGSCNAVAVGLVSQDWATVHATEVALEDNEGPGLVAFWSELTCADCSIRNNEFAGAGSLDGIVELTGGLISGTVENPTHGGGMGVFVDDDMTSSYTRLDGITIEEHALAGVWIQGEAAAQITDSQISGGAGMVLGSPATTPLTVHGNALFVSSPTGPWDGTDGLLLSGNQLSGSHQAAVVLNGGSGTFSGNEFIDNGLDLLVQNCQGDDPPEGIEEIPNVSLCPEYDEVVIPVTFAIQLEDPSAQD